MTERLPPKTLKLLTFLRENSREKLTTISKNTRIPISTLFDTLKELQENYIIKKSTVLLNYEKLGYRTTALILFKVDKEQKQKFRDYLGNNSSVNTIFKVNNDYDLIVETVHKNIRELDNFLECLNKNFNIQKQYIHYLIDEIKREGFVLGEQ